MAVTSVQMNTNQQKQASYLRAGVLGGLGGLLVRYTMPVSKPEYDTFVANTIVKGKNQLSKLEISHLAKAARPIFDFVVPAALILMGVAFVKNMYNSFANKTK
ncbi:hypothetical protein IJS77_04965 [bacterium]|nr:hypothetical protein [bacterium]